MLCNYVERNLNQHGPVSRQFCFVRAVENSSFNNWIISSRVTFNVGSLVIKLLSNPCQVFGKMVRCSAQQENHHDDDEQEADRAAADVERAGKNGRE